MIGRTTRVEPLSVDAHASDLHQANMRDAEGRNWTHLPYGPFDTLDGYVAWLDSVVDRPDPMFHAVVDLATGRAVGVVSYLRIDPQAGSIEVGHINFSPLLQRTVAG